MVDPYYLHRINRAVWDLGRLFLFMGIFTHHVAQTKNGRCVAKYTKHIHNRHGITPSYMYSGKPVSI